MNKFTIATTGGLVFLFTLISDTALAQDTYDNLRSRVPEYEKTGNLTDANSKYKDAIRPYPELMSGSNNYWASAYNTKQKNDDAIKDFDFYFSSDTVNLTVVFNQGLSFLKAGDTTNAKANALKIIELDPAKEVSFSGKHLLDIYDLAMRRKVVKQSLEDAHANMEEEKSIDSKSLANIKLNEAFQKLNNAWLYSSGIEKEDQDLQNTILKDIFFVYPKIKDKPDIPETARKYMIQAESTTKEKKYKDAIALWNKVLTISPYFSIGYFNRALLSELSEDYRSSIEDMKKYLELCPDATDARGAQDKIYEWEGKVKPLEEIVKKYFIANKLDKISEISTIKITARWSTTIPGMTSKSKGNQEIWMKNPDKIKTVTKAFPIESITVFDGEKGYSNVGSKQQIEMTPVQAKEELNSIFFQNPLANYLKNGQLLLEGEEKVTDKPAFKLKVNLESGNSEYLFIDKSSYLLVETKATINQGGQTYTSESYPSNYTVTDGILLPMVTTTTTHYSGGEYTTITAYDKVEVNIPMDNAIFKPPKR